MKQIGIVICNYNKKNDALACIRSILESKFQDYDIYVVDNASTDGSAEAIRNAYGEQVTLCWSIRKISVAPEVLIRDCGLPFKRDIHI